MLNSLINIIFFEIKITLRQAFSWATPLLFFVIVTSLFPLALGPDSSFLKQAAPGIIWVAALLSVLISIGNLFRTDALEGYLDIVLLSETPLSLFALCKVFSYWLTHCLPLILISPLLGLLLGLHIKEQLVLVLTLLLGTPVLCFLGGIGAALMIGIRGSGLLLPVLIMPFYIPTLIFGTGAILGLNAPLYPLSAYFAIMGALLLISLAFAPFLTAIALRGGVSQ